MLLCHGFLGTSCGLSGEVDEAHWLLRPDAVEAVSHNELLVLSIQDVTVAVLSLPLLLVFPSGLKRGRNVYASED